MGIVTDIMKLVSDFKQALADDKIDRDEAAKIAIDLAEVLKELAALIPLIIKYAPKA